MSRPFILRPVATTLLMVALLLAGALAYRLLPVSALPQVDYPTIQVVTFYPGASPDVMASSVTAPLERQLGQMPGLNQMTSTSSGGSSLITLQFALELPLDVAEQEVQAAINASFTLLPPDLPNPPVYSKVNPADTPILTLGLTSPTLPLPRIEDLADTRFAQKISQLPGVGLVSISGGQRPAVRVQANPTALAAYGLTLEDLRAAIDAANVNQAKGSFDGPRQSSVIGANDQLLTSRDYRPLIVAYRNGAPVTLDDVASVIDDAENVRQAAWMNGEPAVILNVQRQPGANVIEVVDRIERLLPQLEASLPSSIHVSVLTDRTVTIRASVADVQFATLFTQLNQYRVVLEVQPAFRQSREGLRDIYVRGTSAGPAVPLSALTRAEDTTAPLAVAHQGQFPSVTLSFNLAPGASLGEAVAAVDAATARLGMPAAVAGSFQGTAQAFRASLASEPLLILAALVAVYIVLGVLYESYVHPLTILSTLPSAGVGAILALMMCGMELDVIALIGIVLLIGIVKKNAIMMIDFALVAEREEGKSARDAIYQACLLRFRPIMMTTMAALLGALPLALGAGVGAELRRPLGVAIAGGLVVSQALTLYTTPVIYLGFDRLARRLRRQPA